MKTLIFKSFSDIKSIRRALTEHGPGQFFKIIYRTVLGRLHKRLDRRFDAKHGVDTCDFVHASELTTERSSPDIEGDIYQPTSTQEVKAIFAGFPAPQSDYVLIDFGSGKGRVLLAAAAFGFKRVIGVEFARELDAIARRNIAIYRENGGAGANIETICIDASDFPIPDDPCVFYFFNPFKQTVMMDVIRNIESSYRALPRKMYLVYNQPFLTHVLDQLPFLRRYEPRRSRFRLALPARHEVVIYETAP